MEPSFNKDKCSVSWHADSSLDHYSSIAVYHNTDHDPNYRPGAKPDWRIGLRVSHDAEGPTSTKLKVWRKDRTPMHIHMDLHLQLAQPTLTLSRPVSGNAQLNHRLQS